LYADLSGLAKTELFAGLLSSASTLLRERLDEQKTACFRTFATNGKELALGVAGDSSSVVLLMTFDPGQRHVLDACINALGPHEKTRVVLTDDVLLVAEKDSVVEAALNAKGAHASGFKHRLVGDQWITWSGDVRQTKLTGTISWTKERFLLDLGVDVHDERDARMLELLLERAKRVDGSAEAQAAKSLLNAIEWERKDDHFDLRLNLVGAPSEQAYQLGMGAALAIYGVRRYLANAKRAEAYNTLGQIGKDYATWWERERASGKRAREKLLSFPAVPADVPAAKKYQSQASDWKAWEPIRFSFVDPQYYQYEVRAAKDGESAEIIARGDLDGDGKLSTFTLPMRLDKKSRELTLGPQIQETDPDE
jgi:type IV pilus assembly protein PilA